MSSTVHRCLIFCQSVFCKCDKYSVERRDVKNKINSVFCDANEIDRASISSTWCGQRRCEWHSHTKCDSRHRTAVRTVAYLSSVKEILQQRLNTQSNCHSLLTRRRCCCNSTARNKARVFYAKEGRLKSRTFDLRFVLYRTPTHTLYHLWITNSFRTSRDGMC